MYPQIFLKSKFMVPHFNPIVYQEVQSIPFAHIKKLTQKYPKSQINYPNKTNKFKNHIKIIQNILKSFINVNFNQRI